MSSLNKSRTEFGCIPVLDINQEQTALYCPTLIQLSFGCQFTYLTLRNEDIITHIMSVVKKSFQKYPNTILANSSHRIISTLTLISTVQNLQGLRLCHGLGVWSPSVGTSVLIGIDCKGNLLGLKSFIRGEYLLRKRRYFSLVYLGFSWQVTAAWRH